LVCRVAMSYPTAAAFEPRPVVPAQTGTQ